MNDQTSYRAIILINFVVPLAVMMGVLYGISSLLVYWFSASLNLQILMPVWFMIYVRTFAKTTYKRLPAWPEHHLRIIKTISGSFMVLWFYWVFRALYSPIMSLILALVMLVLPIGGQYLGAFIDTWRKQKKTI